MIARDQFYVPDDGPPKQGDILLAGVARLVAVDAYTPRAWLPLDVYTHAVASGGLTGNDIRLRIGPALVLTTSHDCHFDKEWNRRVRQLVKGGVDQQEAERIAEEDPTLDRAFVASPLISPDDLGVDRRQLMDGKVLGYFPIPASEDGLIPETVADLTYRVTLDRLDVVRIACISLEAQTILRYSLARLDALRSPTVGFDLEAVIGQRIERVESSSSNPLEVDLYLENSEIVRLLKQPGGPEPGPARTRGPGQ